MAKVDRVPYEDIIQDAAKNKQVSPNLLKALIEQESNFNQTDQEGRPLTPGTSSAVGLTQIIPKWHPEYDPHLLATDPEYNIHAGAHHLSSLMARANPNLDQTEKEKWALGRYYGSKDPYENKRYAASVMNKRNKYAQDGVNSQSDEQSLSDEDIAWYLKNKDKAPEDIQQDVQQQQPDQPQDDTPLSDEDIAWYLKNKDTSGQPTEGRTAGDYASDVGISLEKGIVGAGQGLVGIADIPTGGYAGKLLAENVYDLGKKQEELTKEYSPEQRSEMEKLQKAEGVAGNIQAMFEHPTATGALLMESAPSMVAGGILGKVAKVAGLTASLSTAAGIGEGVIAGGSAAENLRAQSEDKLMSGKDIGASLGTMATTFALGKFGSEATKALGGIDIDTLFAGGARKAAAKVVGEEATSPGVFKRILMSTFGEGVLEEAPQSALETMWQNYATDRPLTEGVESSAIKGGLLGSIMGATAGAISSEAPHAIVPPPLLEGGTPEQPLNEHQAKIAEEATQARKASDIEDMGITPDHKLYDELLKTDFNTPEGLAKVQTLVEDNEDLPEDFDFDTYDNLIATQQEKIKQQEEAKANAEEVQPSAEEAAQGENRYSVSEPTSKISDRYPNATEEQKARLDMTNKEAAKRSAKLTEGAKQIERGEITNADYQKLVNENKPVTAYNYVPKPESNEDMWDALDKDKREKLNLPIDEGKKVNVRLDIPAYTNHGVWVPTIHEGGKSIAHRSTSIINNVTMKLKEKLALNIASRKEGINNKGEKTITNKTPIATMEGEWENHTPEQAEAEAKQAMDEYNKGEGDWRQVGMDPERHSYFYDRETQEPITSADRVIQIGALVLAKNTKRGAKAKEDYLYSASPSSETTGHTAASLRRTMSPEMKTLEASGKVVLHDTQDTLPGENHPANVKGMTTAEGVTHYVANKLTPSTMESVALHEVGVHAGMENMLGKELWEDVKNQALNNEGAAFDKARASVPKGTPAHLRAEETLAYLVEHSPQLSLVRRIVAAIRNFLRAKAGVNIRLSEADARQMAVASMRREASTGAKTAREETAFSFAGEKAKTANISSLKDAQKRITFGENFEKVRQDTGWYKEKDGKWRFEINDQTAKLKKSLFGKDFTGKTKKLSDVLDHPELFKAYPYLKNAYTRINIDKNMSEKDEDGSHRTDNKKLTLITVNARTVDKAVSILLHEIQHSIQEHEGFATGANPDKALTLSERTHYNHLNDENVDLKKKFNILKDKIFSKYPTKSEALASKEYIELEKISVNIHKNDTLINKYNALQWDRYTKSHGEVEARNTQERLSFSNKQRNETSPEETADISSEFKNIFFNDTDSETPTHFKNQPKYSLSSSADEALAESEAQRTASQPPAKAPKSRMQSISDAATAFEVAALSYDAAFIKTLRARIKTLGIPIADATKLLMEASQSQTVHASALSAQAAILGKLEKNSNTLQWEATQGDHAIVDIKPMLEAIATKHGRSYKDIDTLFGDIMAASRIKELRERPVAIKEQMESATTAQKKKFYKKKYDKALALANNQHLTPAQVDKYLKVLADNPDFKEPLKKWRAVREYMVKFLVATGRYSDKQARAYLEAISYVPFNRVMDMKDPEKAFIDMAQGHGKKLSNLSAGQREYAMKGSLTKQVDDIVTNMEKWVFASFNKGINADKGRQLVDLANNYFAQGSVTKVPAKETHADGDVAIYRGGKKEYWRFQDPLIQFAFNGVNPVAMESLKLGAKFANALRQSIVLNPLFTISQLPQDTFSAMFSSGLKNPMVLPFTTLSEFYKTMRGTSEAHAILKNIGAVGQRDPMDMYSQSIHDLAYNQHNEKRGVGASIMRGLNAIAGAGDNSLRQAVYIRTKKELGNNPRAEAIAQERAFEIINFRRRGASSAIDMVRQITPFLGAYLQAQRVALNTLTLRGIAPTERSDALKALAGTTAQVIALTVLYNALLGDDDDFKKKDAREKDTKIFLLGSKSNIALPIRPDLFSLPFVMTNHAYNYITENGVEHPVVARKAIKDALIASIVGMPMGPTVIKPVLETNINHDFFTGRDIIPMRLQGREKSEQYTERTSEFAKLLGKTNLVSPMIADHVIKGMTGYSGAAILQVTDMALRAGLDLPYTQKTVLGKDIRDVPGVSTLYANEKAIPGMDRYYQLSEDVNLKFKTLSGLKTDKKREAAKEYKAEHKALLNQGVHNQLNNMREKISELTTKKRIIAETPNTKMSPDVKRAKIDAIDIKIGHIMKAVPRLENKAYK